MLKEEITKSLGVIENAIQWGDRYEPGTFPKDKLKIWRRELKKIKYALEENCSAAAYGESQVGKSYLIGSLLASPSKPLYITDGSKNYHFVNDINPSGGSTAKKESTGVITRFSLMNDNPAMAKYVKIRTLSVADLVLVLSDSYYNDVNRDLDKELDTVELNERIDKLLAVSVSSSSVQSALEEDDIYEIKDYFEKIIRTAASNVSRSKIFVKLAAVIDRVPQDRWADIFALLWNDNEPIKNIFRSIVEEYSKIGFKNVVYVPFDTLLKEHGSLLKISWIDTICTSGGELDTDIVDTDILDGNGNVIARNFPKSYLSLLTAEVNFFLPPEIKEDRPFLEKVDLLDFPGARRREAIEENDVEKQIPEILRRGKVAYIFRKYSRSLKLNALMFCKDQDMNGDSTIGASLTNWIGEAIAETPTARQKVLDSTGGLSPFMIIATKFNNELKWTCETPETHLDDKWKTRFDRNLLEEVIQPKTNAWFDEWAGGKPFQSIFPLRDFFWSRDQHIFDGYLEGVSGEQSEVKPSSYPEYRNDLKESFVNYPFVMKHFENPSKSWDSFATLGNDGTKPIINTLSKLAGHLDGARLAKYSEKFAEICAKLDAELGTHFISENVTERIDQARRVSGDIKLSLELSFGMNPDVFGKITKQFMAPVEDIRKLTYDIICRHTEKPQDSSMVNVIRMNAGINPERPRSENIAKLVDKYGKSEAELAEFLKQYGIGLEDVVAGNEDICVTESDLLAKRISELWLTHISDAAEHTSGMLAHSSSVSSMYKMLFKKVNLRAAIHKKVDDYLENFDKDLVPNVIADSVSLLLDNFITNVGWEYMTEEEKAKARKIAEQCRVALNLEDTPERKQRPLKDVLQAFDKSSDLLKGQHFNGGEVGTLRQLPLWDNFMRWENLLIIGIMYTSDIVECDPVANAEIEKIIEEMHTIKY